MGFPWLRIWWPLTPHSSMAGCSKHLCLFSPSVVRLYPGIILCMCPANERRRSNVTTFPIAWAHTQNDHFVYAPSQWETTLQWTQDSGLRTQAWFIQRKIIQIQNISGHQYIKWTYVQWKGKIVTATVLLHLPKTEGESPPQSAATSQWRPLRSSAYNGAFLT